jgi:hypothetical protein
MLKESLGKLGYTQSVADPGIFYKDDVYLLLYVDDQLIMGPDQQKINDAILEIGAEYEITDMGPATMFLGVELIRSPGRIKLSQKKIYIVFAQKVCI